MNALDYSDRTPIYYVTTLEDFKLLIEHGAEVEHVDWKNNTLYDVLKNELKEYKDYKQIIEELRKEIA